MNTNSSKTKGKECYNIYFHGAHLDWLFILVLAVARAREPLDKYDAISSFVRTSASVTPASVIPPFAVSLICIGSLPGAVVFADAASTLDKTEFESSKSNTSSLNICRRSYISKLPDHKEK